MNCGVIMAYCRRDISQVRWNEFDPNEIGYIACPNNRANIRWQLHICRRIYTYIYIYICVYIYIYIHTNNLAEWAAVCRYTGNWKKFCFPFIWKTLAPKWSARTYVNWLLLRNPCLVSVGKGLTNTLRPGDTDMRQWTSPLLVQMMACHLFGTKPLSELWINDCYW